MFLWFGFNVDLREKLLYTFTLNLIFYYFFKILFIYFQREGKGGREGQKHQCVVASGVPPTGHLAHNSGMCPDWESNPSLHSPVLNPLSHASQGLHLLKKNFFFIYTQGHAYWFQREREEGREREREKERERNTSARNIYQLPLTCGLTRNQPAVFSFMGQCFNPLSHTGQGSCYLLIWVF